MATTIGPTEMLVGGILVAIGLILAVLKVKNTGARFFLGAVVLLLGVYGVVQYRRVRTIPSTSGDQTVTYFADPKVLIDEDVSVGARSSQGRRFTLSANDAVEVVAEGKAHADKVFVVHVMSAEDFANFEKKRPFHYSPAFEAQTKSFSRTDVLPPGDWYVVVDNAENGSSAIGVHLRVVTNPG